MLPAGQAIEQGGWACSHRHCGRGTNEADPAIEAATRIKKAIGKLERAKGKAAEKVVALEAT